MTSSIKVSIKWQKNKYDMEVDTSTGIDGLRAQLMSLTSVPPERQKILSKGKQIKTDEDLKKIQNGANMMMMGEAELAPEPEKVTVFMEDLSEEQLRELKTALPLGFQNLGNTCYLNSTLHNLRLVKEFKNSVIEYSLKHSFNTNTLPDHKLTHSLGQLFLQYDRNTDPTFALSFFLREFKSAFPRFAQTTEKGFPMQQDADEAWTEIINSVFNVIGDTKINIPSLNSESILLRNLFAFQIIQSFSLADDSSKKLVTQSVNKTEYKLRCNITNKTLHLLDGIETSLNEQVEKHSSELGTTALHNLTQKIDTLPIYFTVQFVRFFYKKEAQAKAKICRKVVFPLILSVENFCTDELKKVILSRRAEKFKKEEKLKNLTDEKEKEKEKIDKKEKSETNTTTPMSDIPILDDSKRPFIGIGQYELIGIVTHKGRSADGGHYIGWTKNPDHENKHNLDKIVNEEDLSEEKPKKAGSKIKKDELSWLKFDDANVTEVTENTVQMCQGGSGDGDIVYIALYRSLNEKY